MEQENLDLSMIILAGGESRRMGRDKASLLYEGKTFLQHQIEKGRALGIRDILVSGYRGEDCDCPVIPDRHEKKGPLGGIEACMRRAKHRKCLVVTVDMPSLPVSALEALAEAGLASDAPAVLLQHGGRFEPLISVLDTGLRPRLEAEAFRSGSLMRVLRETGYALCELPDSADFQNVNDPMAYSRLCSDGKAPGPEPGTLRERRVARWEKGVWQPMPLTLIEETTLSLAVNGRTPQEIVCSPTSLRALVIGRLFCAGEINGMEDLLSLELDEESMIARAETRASLPRETRPVAPIAWEPSWIEQLARNINEGTPIYRASRSAHSCQLMRRGELLCCMEDLGRHNAVDKVFGWALEKGIELADCLVFSSGRLPVDMVRKLIRGGVPACASKAMPTGSAVDLAERYGVTLLHFSPGLGLVRITGKTGQKEGAEDFSC